MASLERSKHKTELAVVQPTAKGWLSVSHDWNELN